MMTEDQRAYWRHRLWPLIDFGGSYDPSIEHLPMCHWPNASYVPWLWHGARNKVPPTRRRTGNRVVPQAIARSPGLPLFPAPKSRRVSVDRILWHLFVGPLAGRERLVYAGPRLDYANVNPFFHRLGSGGPVCGSPTTQDLGETTDLEELVSLMREGSSPSILAEVYGVQLFAEAQAIVAQN